MYTLYISFGCRYATEVHPVFAEAHPDGVLKVVGDNYSDCRSRAYNALNGRFAFDYTEEEFEESRHHFPAGVTHELTKDGEFVPCS